MLFPTIGWPTTSALAANLTYLYTLPLYTFFSSLYYNVVIQSTLLQHCDIYCTVSIVYTYFIYIECKGYYCGHLGKPLGEPSDTPWMVAGYVPEAHACSI